MAVVVPCAQGTSQRVGRNLCVLRKVGIVEEGGMDLAGTKLGCVICMFEAQPKAPVRLSSGLRRLRERFDRGTSWLFVRESIPAVVQ